MSRRTLRAAEAIRQVVGMAILTEIRDPRVKDVTVLRAEVSGDMQNAKIFVSVMGDEKKQQLCLRGLQSCAGFLQAKVAERIEARYTPRLEFVLDQGVKNQLHISKMLDEMRTKEKPAENIQQEHDSTEENDVPKESEE